MERGLLSGISHLHSQRHDLEIGVPQCVSIFNNLGHSSFVLPVNLSECLKLHRLTACLLELAVMSYVGSHASHFGLHGAHKRREDMNIFFCGDVLPSFSCQLRRLACLDGLLDSREVWVFSIPLTDSQIDDDVIIPMTQPLAQFTKINTLADIWGPVWAVPKEDKISHYRVSKGYICRVDRKKGCRVPGAFQCHWYPEKSERYGDWDPRAPLLNKDDLLLIEGELRNHEGCQYTLESYASQRAEKANILGTKAKSWSLESRSLSIGFAKFVGASLIGTQKLVPETTVKEHALNEWTNRPERANPEILNNAYGIVISHCTGNAKRVALKHLMTSALSPLLESVNVMWSDRPWGFEFMAALKSSDDDAVVNFWLAFEEYRKEAANLILCVLEVLDTTGYVDDNFEAALFCNRKRRSVRLDVNCNDWSVVLKDSRRMASYVAIDEYCLEYLDQHNQENSRFSDHRVRKARTVLQTQMEITDGPANVFTRMIINPSGDKFWVLGRDCVSKNMLMREQLVSRILPPPPNCAKGQEKITHTTDEGTKVTYISASVNSYHGWKEMRY